MTTEDDDAFRWGRMGDMGSRGKSETVIFEGVIRGQTSLRRGSREKYGTVWKIQLILLLPTKERRWELKKEEDEKDFWQDSQTSGRS